PGRAMELCLKHAGWRARDIDHVAYSLAPRLRRKHYRPEWWPDPIHETVFTLRLAEVRSVAERILGRPLGQRFHFVPHHLAHAASAFFPSGFERAAILIIDGLGEADCSTLATGIGKQLRILERFDYPHSLGCVWELISLHLGFSGYDASKVMGLAAYGNPATFRRQFAAIIRVGAEEYAVDPAAAGFMSANGPGPDTLLGPPRFSNDQFLPRHADIAAALQEATDAAVLALVRRLKRKAPFENLCLAGGVALNCVT